MIGPSSSHTAGAIRLGRVARQLFGEVPQKAVISLYGSFAETYEGHGTDLALVGGLLDYETDDPRIPQSLQYAEEAGLEVVFAPAKKPAFHPNTASLLLSSAGSEISVTGASIGGGNIEIINVDRFDVKFTGLYPTLVISHEDRPGIIADITAILRTGMINIGYMDVDRKARKGEAMTVIEIDSRMEPAFIDEIRKVNSIYTVRLVDLTERKEL